MAVSERIRRLMAAERITPPDRASTMPARRATAGTGSGILFFKLTSIAATPMTGTRVVFDGNSESPTFEQWIDAESNDPVDIYPHPEAEITDYQEHQITPCVKSGGQWQSLDGAGGEMEIIWATVVRRPLRAEQGGDPEEGYDDYRLILESIPAWQPGTYDQDDVVQHDQKIWRSDTDSNTDEPPTNWTEAEDLYINPQHFDFGEVDWRDFVPWYAQGTDLPLLKKIVSETVVYYFWQQMTRVRHLPTGHQSIMWHETEERLIGVYG